MVISSAQRTVSSEGAWPRPPFTSAKRADKNVWSSKPTAGVLFDALAPSRGRADRLRETELRPCPAASDACHHVALRRAVEPFGRETGATKAWARGKCSSDSMIYLGNPLPRTTGGRS